MEDAPNNNEIRDEKKKQSPSISQEIRQLTEQPSWRRIEELRQKSKFTRSAEYSPNTTIENSEQLFTLQTIESGKETSLSDVQALFERTFGAEEVDPEKILRESVDGITSWGTTQARYRIIGVRNESGQMIGTIAGAPLDLLDEHGKPTGEMVYFVGYAVIDPSARKNGIAREAYISALMDATDQAAREGKKLKFAIGECTDVSEKYWNDVGWKRIYAQEPNELTSFTEVPYMQPALDFDEDTGEVAEGVGEAPEHLMMDSFGSQAPTKEDLLRAYDAFMSWNAHWPRQAFGSDEAFASHQAYTSNLEGVFAAFLESHNSLLYLDAEARTHASENNIKINEHEGFKNNADEEDF